VVWLVVIVIVVVMIVVVMIVVVMIVVTKNGVRIEHCTILVYITDVV
jgi:hypothetical protein